MRCFHHGGGTSIEKFTVTVNCHLQLLFLFQVYLVAGGCSLIDVSIDVGMCHQSGYLPSTEIYRRGQWVTAGPLPVAVTGVRGVTLDNTVFMTGYILYSDL